MNTNNTQQTKHIRMYKKTVKTKRRRMRVQTQTNNLKEQHIEQTHISMYNNKQTSRKQTTTNNMHTHVHKTDKQNKYNTPET